MSILIGKEIEIISEVISDNGSCLEELADSSLEQNNSINNIALDAKKLCNLSRKLQEQVGIFTIKK
jgi:hypothetical protein